MSGSKAKIIELEKRRFDLFWFLMVGLGLTSIIVSSHPLNHAAWLPDVTLGLALCIGFVLATFVRRVDAPAATTSHDEMGLGLASNTINVAVDPIIKNIIEIRTIDDDWHTIPFGDIEGTGARQSFHYHSGAFNNAIWKTSPLRHSFQEEVVTATREAVHSYFKAISLPPRRDLVREVVEIAKQLRGTGMEVKLTADDEISVCESRRLPFPDDLARDQSSETTLAN